MKPGIYEGLSNDEYHASEGISKSSLWTIETRTPAHYKYGEKKRSSFFDIGTLAHLALLEPGSLETRWMIGPADRRGNKWIDAQAQADHEGRLLVTSGDSEKILRIRDAGEKSLTLIELRRGAQIEVSGYAQHQGVLCRCRPDAWSPTHGVILDLKTTTAASKAEFSRSAGNFGYHFQEAFYTDVWNAALDNDTGVHMARVEAFVFVVIETTAPFLVSCYELKPTAVQEGRERYTRALEIYARCLKSGAWPGYPQEPEPLDIPRWAYQIMQPPGMEEI